MFVLGCLQHWYTSIIFFAPVPIFAILLGLSNRRERRRNGGGGSDKGLSSV